MRILLTLLCVGGLAFAAAATHAPAPDSPQQPVPRHGSNVVLIEGVGEPGQGWVEIAPVGSPAKEPGASHGLVKIPFSVLGDTKVLVNMEHAAWVYIVGQETEIGELGGGQAGSTDHAPEAPAPILLSGIGVDSFVEVNLDHSLTHTLEGGFDYLFPQDGFRWMKLPVGAEVGLLQD